MHIAPSAIVTQIRIPKTFMHWACHVTAIPHSYACIIPHTPNVTSHHSSYYTPHRNIHQHDEHVKCLETQTLLPQIMNLLFLQKYNLYTNKMFLCPTTPSLPSEQFGERHVVCGLQPIELVPLTVALVDVKCVDVA